MKLIITAVDQTIFIWQVEKVSIPTVEWIFALLPQHTNMIAVLVKWDVTFIPVHVTHSALDEFRDHTVHVPIQWWICKIVDNEVILSVTEMW